MQEHIRKKMEREGMIGMAVAGGAALVIGGIVGIGMALAKKQIQLTDTHTHTHFPFASTRPVWCKAHHIFVSYMLITGRLRRDMLEYSLIERKQSLHSLRAIRCECKCIYDIVIAITGILALYVNIYIHKSNTKPKLQSI